MKLENKIERIKKYRPSLKECETFKESSVFLNESQAT